jgi:HlyD family secretion protein
MLKYGLPVIAAFLLVFAVLSVLHSRPILESTSPPEAPPVATYPHTVAGAGIVEASSENISLSTPVSGLITHVYVKAGDHVQAGERLFSLDDRDLQAELQLRKSSLEVARAQLHKLIHSPRPEEVPVAEAKVAEAAQALADAKVQQQLIESSADKRAFSKQELLRRPIATKVAEARLSQAKADLALLRAGAWNVDIEIARAQVAFAGREVQRVQTDIDRLTVTAPIDGDILQLNIHVGEYAQGGPLAKPLILFGNVDVVNVRTDVDEHDAWKLRAGAAAYATVRGNSDLRVPLQFVRFEPYVVPKKSLTGDSTERVDTRVLQVLYSFDRGQLPVYVGQQMDVFVEAPPIGSTISGTGMAQRPSAAANGGS